MNNDVIVKKELPIEEPSIKIDPTTPVKNSLPAKKRESLVEDSDDDVPLVSTLLI